ncbi:MAG TPA: YfhO family protein [Acidimicrobiales bacterium]|nr:YfhO family protein [Acidimicrobiales bacterium]
MTSPRQVLQASAVLAALLVVFLWQPISSNGYYATTDLLQSSPMLRDAPANYTVKNALLGDPVWQMHPWLEWNRDQLSHGRLPVWNPYNAAGVPHLANSVSAVLSPFSLPFYALPFRIALFLAAGLKLFVLGLFTYLYLRRLRVSHLAGIVGAVAFMFSAYNILWLNWPHPGAAVCLPAGLWLVEVARAAADRARRWAALAAYAGIVAWAFLAGHPETLFFCMALVLGYAVVRLGLTAGPARQRVGRVAEVGAATLLGAGISGVQTLPFVEYLLRSTSYAEGATRALTHFDPRFATLLAFPNLFGSPATNYYDPGPLRGTLRLPGGAAIGSNYNEAVGFYIGLLVLLLAGAGAVSLVRRRGGDHAAEAPRVVVAFFTVTAALWFLWAHDIGGLGRVVGSLPLVELSVVSRSQPVWLFALSCLAAVGLDHLCAPRGRRLLVGAAFAAGGAVLLLLALVSERLLRNYFGGLPANTVASALARKAVGQHIRYISLTFVAGVGAVGLLVAGRGRSWTRVGGGALLVAMVFAQSGFLLRHYNPTVDPRYFYPVTPAVTAVSDAVGSDTVLIDGLMNPDTNLWYRLHMPTSYDGVGVADYDLLQRRMLAVPDAIHWDRLAKVLGVRYVATTGVAVGMQEVGRSGSVGVFRVPGGSPRYYSPGDALPVAGNEDALRLLERPDFDPQQTVLIHAAVAASVGAAGAVEVIREDPTEIHLRVARDSPGWLVALVTRYPGWKATVNGRTVPLRRANVAFTAVPVGPGASDVVLRYQPDSVRYGLALTAASLLVVVALLGWSVGPGSTAGTRAGAARRARRAGGYPPVAAADR